MFLVASEPQPPKSREWNRGTNRRGRTDEGVCPYANTIAAF